MAQKLRAPAQPTNARVSQGPIHSVPCPWCQQTADFRELADEELGGAGWGNQLEPGAIVGCDNCNRPSKILAVAKVVIVKLTQA